MIDVPIESLCRQRGQLHQYEFVRDMIDSMEDVCVKCGKHLLINKKDNNKKYYDTHTREFLQPWSARYNGEFKK